MREMAEKTYKPIKFNVVEPFYLHIKKKINKNKVLEVEPIYRLWKCSFGEGNVPFLILTNPINTLSLGDNEKCLAIPTYEELVNYFLKHGIPEEHIIKQLIKLFNFEPIYVENTKEIDYNKTFLAMLQLGKIYKITLPITNDYLQELIENPSELKRQIDLFLTEGCKKDS